MAGTSIDFCGVGVHNRPMTPTGMSSLTVQCWNCRGLSCSIHSRNDE